MRGFSFAPPLQFSCSGPVAQWLEQRTHNPLVPGSSPGRPTNQSTANHGVAGIRQLPGGIGCIVAGRISLRCRLAGVLWQVSQPSKSLTKGDGLAYGSTGDLLSDLRIRSSGQKKNRNLCDDVVRGCCSSHISYDSKAER